MHSEKVPYFILDLLQQVPSVYVAGLGRFEAIFHPAVIDLQESRIKPPYLEPGFSADGEDQEDILPSYIQYVTGVDREKAQEYIREFVKGVQNQIQTGETYSIEKFGTFSNSTNGILHFTPDWDAFNLSFRGLEELSLHAPVEQQTDEVRYAPEIIAEPAFVEPTYKEPENNVEPITERKWVTDYERPEPETIPVVQPATLTPVISDSTSRLWWIILATALFMITVLCAYLTWDILSNRKNINRYIAITSDSLSDSSPDMVIIDTLEFIEEELPAIDSPVVEADPEPEPVEPKSVEPPCFVVVGAFSDASNVVKMEDRLRGLGYESEQIKGGSLTRVAIRTSCEKATLQKTLNDARSAINPEAWIY